MNLRRLLLTRAILLAALILVFLALVLAGYLSPPSTPPESPPIELLDEPRRSRVVLCDTGRDGVERCKHYLCEVMPAEADTKPELVCEAVKLEVGR